MPYITREDGEHFVIPSYRDVLVAKQKSTLKKEILLLSQSYGEYITLQRKGTNQYEIAFSPEQGYLLGESIWHYFKRPIDFIYCEEIAGSTEAILVIVKAGSVYLDGSFPLDSIPEELVIFLTQQNNFEIYIYGNVPISQTQQEGKFNFEPSAVKSFSVLDKPVFPTLPLVKAYQLQLVDQVLKAQGIGVFPLKPIIAALVALGIVWLGYSYLTSKRPVLQPAAPEINPYQGYIDNLITPAPEDIINEFIKNLYLLNTMPGWSPTSLLYTKGNLTVTVSSQGAKIQRLSDWANDNGFSMLIQTGGILLSKPFTLNPRRIPSDIYPATQVVTQLVDNISTVYPGNHTALGAFQKKGVFTVIPVTINFSNVTPLLFTLIGSQLADLPYHLTAINTTYSAGTLSGTILLDALGN